MATAATYEDELADLYSILDSATNDIEQKEAIAQQATQTAVVEDTPPVQPAKQTVVIEADEVVAATTVTQNLDESDLAALEEIALEVEMQPTQNQVDAAVQQVQLDGVFEKPVDSSIDDDLAELDMLAGQAVTPEPEPEPVVEPKKRPEPEPEPEPVIEAQETPVVEPHKPVTTAPQAEGTPQMSEKAIKESASLRYRPDVIQFQRETKITDATLNQCMMDQASLVAYYSARYAEAESQAMTVKMKFEMLEAGLYDAYRKYFLAQGEKATEKAIENAVRMDKKWATARKLYIEARMYADTYHGFINSLRDRSSMLIQRGAATREEMKGQIRTIQREFNEQDERTELTGRAANIDRSIFPNT
ncbi:hypothetical protein [Acinetobacter brisouii]|uniref:hypothetical protein n=1 Tax=Acinetobacter brisouii TaxID=396323 RepID=UPI00148F400C|nr:hypothetical protein [Acinetobacter brisouii]